MGLFLDLLHTLHFLLHFGCKIKIFALVVGRFAFKDLGVLLVLGLMVVHSLKELLSVGFLEQTVHVSVIRGVQAIGLELTSLASACCLHTAPVLLLLTGAVGVASGLLLLLRRHRCQTAVVAIQK